MGAGWRKGREPGDPWDSQRPVLLLILRSVFCLFTFGAFLAGIVSVPTFYFIFLTHWGVCSVLLFYISSLLAIRWRRFAPVSHALYELAWTLEFIISIVFWTWVYPQETDAAPLAYNVSVHACMLLFILCDYPLNRLSFRTKWALFPICTLICYSIVNVPITFDIGEVYPRMNYENGWTYLVICYSFIVCIAAYALGKVLDRLKASRRRFSESTEMLNHQGLVNP